MENDKNPSVTVRNVPPFKRYAALGIENVLEVATHAMRQAVSYSFPHVHDDVTFEIIHLASGRLADKVAGRRYALVGGDVLVVFPNDHHGEIPFPDTRGVVYWMKLCLPTASSTSFINLRGAPAKGLLSMLWKLKPRHFRGSPQLKRHFDAIIRCLDSNTPDATTPATVAHHVHACLMEVILCARLQSSGSTPEWAARLVNHIDDHLADPVRIKDIAIISGFTQSSFKKIFKRKFGMPPIEYVMRRRIAKARELIRQHPEKSITDIALDLGFSSSQVFATSFKRYCGKTPTYFRKHSWG